MNSPEMQFVPIEWLVVGCRGVPSELALVLGVCRHYDGTIIQSDGEVMVMEFGAAPETIDEVLARLPALIVTHAWRSGSRSGPPRRPRAEILRTNFCPT